MTTRRRDIATKLGLVAVAALLAACGRAGAPQGGDTPGEIHFAVLSAEPATLADAAWRPIQADMQRRTGLKVRIHVYASPAALTQALRNRAVDAGVLSNLAGLDVVRRGGGEVFARTDNLRGTDDHASVLIAGTHAERPLTLARALACKRNLTLGMGEATSITGALAPTTYLFAPRQIDPQTCFKQVRIDADPEAELAAVVKGDLDLAVVGAGVLTADHARGGTVTVLWRSPPLPQTPLVRRKTLNPVIKEKLRQFFLTYGQGDGPDAAKARDALARVGIGGFKPADDSHLLPIREMEATEHLYAAQHSGDPARIAATRAALDDVTAQRIDLEARTRAPATAQ